MSDDQQDVPADLDQELDQAAAATKQKLQQDPALSQSLGGTSELQQEVVDIERDLLDEIVRRLDQNKMSSEDAQKLAQEFLAFLPIQDQRDLLNKLLQLSRDNGATQGIYLKYAKPFEEEERQRKLTLMSQHIHKGQIEEALAVAKGEIKNA